MTFKIEKDVPMPAKGGAGRSPKYPWEDMKVGDSFFVEGTKNAPMPSKGIREKGLKFASRSVEGGMRVWRIE